MSSSGQQLQKFYLARKGPRVLDIWNDGIICAFEFVPKSNHMPNSYWSPIGWKRISELMKIAETSVKRSSQQLHFMEDEVDFTDSVIATRPRWWCHVFGGDIKINEWLKNAHWLDPSISTCLTDGSTCFSDCMEHFGFEVPIKVESGILFEFFGYSVSDPLLGEDDTPIVLRSYQTQQFLLTVMHVKGSPSKINVPAINKVQDIILTVGTSTLKSVHEVIAQLACRLSRWDDRLFHKFVFGAAIDIELKFVNWKTYKDPNLINIILNEEIKKLTTKVVRAHWSLCAREAIVFELLQHLRGTTTKSLLEEIKNTTSEMLQEQEAVLGRLLTIQETFQSPVRARLEDESMRNTHVEIVGVCGLIVFIIVAIFWANLDGIPGAKDTSYAFLLFCGLVIFFGILLIYFSIRYFGLKKPVAEEQFNARNLEIKQLFFTFKRDVKTHAKVREGNGSTDDVARFTVGKRLPITSYILQAWSRLCKCLDTHEEIDDSDDDSIETITLGDKRIGIRTSVLEEKATACNMLGCYADELKVLCAGKDLATEQTASRMVNILRQLQQTLPPAVLASTWSALHLQQQLA